MPLLQVLTTPDLLVLGDNTPAAGQATEAAGPRGWGPGLGGRDVSSHDLRVGHPAQMQHGRGRKGLCGNFICTTMRSTRNCSRRHTLFSQRMWPPKQNNRG